MLTYQLADKAWAYQAHPPVTGNVLSVGTEYSAGWLVTVFGLDEFSGGHAPGTFPGRQAPGDGLLCPQVIWNGVLFAALPLFCAAGVVLFMAAISSLVPFARPFLFLFLFFVLSIFSVAVSHQESLP